MRRLLESCSLLLFRAILKRLATLASMELLTKTAIEEILAAVEADLNNQVFFHLQRSVRIA